MAADLSLTDALGGLRIANPDDSIPSALHNPANSTSSVSTSSNLQPLSVQAPNPISQGLALPTDAGGPLLSTLDFDPSSYSTDSIVLDQPQRVDPFPLSTQSASVSVPPLPQQQQLPRPHIIRHSSSATPQQGYQGHRVPPPGQYPPYQSNGSPHPTRSPYTPTYPTQRIASNPSPAQPPRDSGYRTYNDPLQTSMAGRPRAGSNRGFDAALQAGVPINESSYSGRTYGNGPPNPMPSGNGPIPRRKVSRGLAPGHPGLSSGPAMGSSSTNGSPYVGEDALPASSEEWKEKGAAVKVRREIDANGRVVQRYSKKGVTDFNFGRTLGEGSYSTVLLGTDRATGKEYAIKVLDKKHIIREKKVKYVTVEKDTLNRLTEHPGVVRLYYTFQDQASLFFCLDLAAGGELLGALKKVRTFDIPCTRFYSAQILDTIEYMHSKGVIHRDLKPENILLDDQMHVKITDFGTAKILGSPATPQNGSSTVPVPGNHADGAEDTRAGSFVGTAEYVSPELLNNKNACKASDLWAFGCIIFQLLTGKPPFKAANEYLTFNKILALEYTFPDGFPEDAKDLVERLLVLDPERRLPIEHIKNHQFFDGVQWGRGLWKQKAPPLRSYVPPSAGPIRLNGARDSRSASTMDINSFPPDIARSSTQSRAFSSVTAMNGQFRPSPRLITEVPPPSQLDIEWSPVLTRSNERILKLGNLLVLLTSSASSPADRSGTHNGEGGSKFSRFFGGGGTTKKKQRLVMVTSSARIIIAAAGSDKKETKFEISLLDPGCSWTKMQDSKGLSYWTINTREKHIVFEDPKMSSSDGSATAAAAQDWLEAIEKARDIALLQNHSNSYSGESSLQGGSNEPISNMDAALGQAAESVSSRNTLQKPAPEEPRGFRRFSKRQSKSGLAAVF